MKYVEVHMPQSDYEMLCNSMDTSSWLVMGVFDKDISEQIKCLFQQIKILKLNQNEKQTNG